MTDDDVLARPAFAADAEAVLRCGPGVALHLRGPSVDAGTMLRLAVRLCPVASDSGSVLLVNDRVDVALEAHLDGVHLGHRSMRVAAARGMLPAHAFVGASVHDPEVASEAWSEGADFLIVGTIFSTPSHPGRTGDGTSQLESVGASGEGPMIAIGGVTLDRLESCIRAGAHGVATLRGVWHSEDPASSSSAYLARIAAVIERKG